MMLAFQAVYDPTNVGVSMNPDILNYPVGMIGCCGFHQPSYNLVNAFKVDNNGLPLLDTFNDEDLKPGDFVDPRLDWTVGRDSVPYLNWGMPDPSWPRDREYSGPFSPKKNAYYKDAGQASSDWGGFYSSLNFHILRYADVLLMLAECEVELNNLNEARDLVNKVRERAGNCAQGRGDDIESITTTIDDPEINWARYRIGLYEDSWTDQGFAHKAVRFERRLELAMEGHRMFDLIRWQTAKEVINDYLEVEKTKITYLNGAQF